MAEFRYRTSRGPTGDFCPQCGKFALPGQSCKDACKEPSIDDFRNFSTRSGAMGEFLSEVGIIVVGVAVWYLVATPLLKKVGVKPIKV